VSTLTQSTREPPEKNPTFEALQARIATAKVSLLEASEPDAIWTCGHCGQTMPSPGRGWLDLEELRKQANPSEIQNANVMSLALSRLVDEGFFKQRTADWKVKRTSKTR